MRTSQKRFPAQNPARWHPYVSSESIKCVYSYTFSAYNAMVTWNTLHIGHVVEQLRAEGHTSDDTTLSLTTPLLRKHINPLGNIISIWSVIAKPQIRRRAKRLKPLTEVFGWMWPVRAGTLLGDEFRIEAGEEKEFLTLLREWKAASPFLARIVLIDLN